MSVVLLDTGPLVALVNGRDRHHAWARDRFAELAIRVRTCDVVLAEACHLLGRAGARTAPLDLVERGVIELSFQLADEHAAVRELMRRYADRPMDLADACLVRMSEQYDDSVVLTLDSDFHAYRRHGVRAIPVLCPP